MKPAFGTGVTGMFQACALTRRYRLEKGADTFAGPKRARERDAAFGGRPRGRSHT